MNEMLALAEKAATLLHLPTRFIAAWWVAENGWTFPITNNPGNISYLGEGHPDPIGIFAGVKQVLPNKVCVYDTPADGVNAFVLLLELPSTVKPLTLTAEELRQVSGNIETLCATVGQSNWAGSHYKVGNDTWEGESIYRVYESPEMKQWMETPSPSIEPPITSSHTVTLTENEALSHIAQRFLIPLPILERANEGNLIEVGKPILLPSLYVVKPGDTLSKIAEDHHTSVENLVRINQLRNPNQLSVRQRLYV